MKKIYLTQDKFALVDAADYQRVLAHNSWHANWNRSTRTFYAFSRKGGKTTSLGRFIMNAGATDVVDHINKDTLDNRKCNLRICTSSQNQMNRGPQVNNVSGYKGIHWLNSKSKWRAQIRYGGKCVGLGLFTCKHEAARAYNLAARMYHGEFAYTNDINIDNLG